MELRVSEVVKVTIPGTIERFLRARVRFRWKHGESKVWGDSGDVGEGQGSRESEGRRELGKKVVEV